MRDLFSPAVIKFGRARALVRRQFLGVFERAPVGKVIGDAGGAKRVIANGRLDAGGFARRRIMRQAAD